jgi:hypothetical protein
MRKQQGYKDRKKGVMVQGLYGSKVKKKKGRAGDWVNGRLQDLQDLQDQYQIRFRSERYFSISSWISFAFSPATLSKFALLSAKIIPLEELTRSPH